MSPVLHISQIGSLTLFATILISLRAYVLYHYLGLTYSHALLNLQVPVSYSTVHRNEKFKNFRNLDHKAVYTTHPDHIKERVYHPDHIKERVYHPDHIKDLLSLFATCC